MGCGTEELTVGVLLQTRLIGLRIQLGVRMRLVISTAEDGDSQAVVSLYRWLSRDATVARYGQVTAQAVSQPGRMSAAFDVINAVFADAGAAAGIGSLLVAYRAWRDTRTQAPALVITKDGVTVMINQGSAEEIQQILGVMLPDIETADPANTTRVDPGER
jgi:Effector Associated Constant Component 1